jgi:predicted Rossmann fold flavoprotein
MQNIDVVIIGAGAAGMMCAIEAGKRGRSVVLIDHADKPGEKIRISGGGRCNFTNLEAGPNNFLSQNKHFMKSALKQYTQHDFIDWMNRTGIAWHEKTLGQLFCDGSARQIIEMLTNAMAETYVDLRLGISVLEHRKTADGFEVDLSNGDKLACSSLVVACGGKSIPKMGATGFGYEVARQYGLEIVETRPALVPLTFDPDALAKFKPFAGVSVDVIASSNGTSFKEAMLFTHRGLSGPAILQISSFWREGDEVRLNLQPDVDYFGLLKAARSVNGKQSLQTPLSQLLPKRFAQYLAEESGLGGNLADQSDKKLQAFEDSLRSWTLKPTGSEGYRTAEVTLGGVDTDGLDSKTMRARHVEGLYFIGEVVDVTGWLGGYNFQWAWSSGWVAGQHA